jgi:hypothetical protein
MARAVTAAASATTGRDRAAAGAAGRVDGDAFVAGACAASPASSPIENTRTGCVMFLNVRSPIEWNSSESLLRIWS